MEAKSHKLFTDQRHKKVKQTFIDTFQSDPTDRLKDRTNTEKHNVLHGLSHLSEWSTDRLKDRTNTEKHNVRHGLSHLSEWSTDRLRDRTNTEKHNVRHGLSPEKWDVEEISHLREIKLNVLQHSGYDPHLKQQANIHTSIRSYCIFWSTKKTFIDKCFSAATLHRLWHWN